MAILSFNMKTYIWEIGFYLTIRINQYEKLVQHCGYWKDFKEKLEGFWKDEIVDSKFRENVKGIVLN